MRFPSLFSASSHTTSTFAAAVVLGLSLCASVNAQNRNTEQGEASITGECSSLLVLSLSFGGCYDRTVAPQLARTLNLLANLGLRIRCDQSLFYHDWHCSLCRSKPGMHSLLLRPHGISIGQLPSHLDTCYSPCQRYCWSGKMELDQK